MVFFKIASRARLLALAGGALLLVGLLALLALPAAPADRAVVESESAAAGADAIICGVTSLGHWGKAYESWDAGGSDYYVMVIDRQYASAHPQFGGGRVILRTSAPDHVGETELASLVGKHGCARGTLREATTYTPQHPWEQYPTDVHGLPLPRGSGMVVRKLGQHLVDIETV